MASCVIAVRLGEAGPGDPEALKSIFRRIDQMKQAKLQKTMPDTMDNFEPFAVVGLIVLALGILALFGLRYTPW